MILMLERVWNLIAWYLRPLFKWLLRKTTRLCEMQRVCYGQPAGALRAIGVGESDRVREGTVWCRFVSA